MPSKTKNATHDGDEDRCPNCGYCPHCGQSAKPPQVIREVVPRPYVQQPWREIEGVPYKIWCGTTTSREGATELRSISNEYVSREEGHC